MILFYLVIIVILVLIISRLFLNKKDYFKYNINAKTKILNYDKHVMKHCDLAKNTGGGGDGEKSYQGISFYDINEGIKGQRDPKKRFTLIEEHIDFKNKSILDIGCNSGEMLFYLHDHGIKYGVGIDFDSYKINMCNLMKKYNNIDNMNFFVIDLQKEDLETIINFLPKEDNKVDIAFLFAICQEWIYPCTKLIDFIYNISDTLVIEINGDENKKQELVEYLNNLYGSVIEITNKSICDDCNERRLFIAQKKESFKKEDLIGNSGNSDIQYNEKSNIILKKVKNKKNYEVEKQWLQELQKFSFVPKVYKYDDENTTFIMENCGERINDDNKPVDFEDQMNYIKTILNKNKLYHNDLHQKNVLVRPDNSVCIIDFEFMSRNPFQYQNRYNNDFYIYDFP